MAAPGEDARTRLEARLNDWFDDNRRGRTARVFVSRRDGVTYFLVRHGEPFKREGSVLNNEPSSVTYRPLRHDVAVYDPVLGELRVHAQLKGERQLYRRAIAEYLVGRDDDFPREAKYSLHPIRRDREDCLACGDVDGLDAVLLRELHFAWGGSTTSTTSRRRTTCSPPCGTAGTARSPSSPAWPRRCSPSGSRGRSGRGR
ncbi:hypothetical protein [Limnoglobus roseus]|uniref:hypothetical protein n=1 Tax=Limnoglobus roseus TaxID=2598579 RepID=UPI0011EB5901|nr:hypothetical protein [Limnoglobus roseus]